MLKQDSRLPPDQPLGDNRRAGQRSRNYATVTEVPGVQVSDQQLDMLYTRYRYAAEFCAGKDVLEVGCGPGQGLGYLAKQARRVVGSDYTASLLKVARQHYRETTPLVQLDAQDLPFQDRSFDVIIFYEAIYYLSQPEQFLNECCRVLRDSGVLLICTVNKEWADFNPSPFSTRYPSAKELSELLLSHHMQVELYGAFPVPVNSIGATVVSLIKRAAIKFGLMPKTMKGKELLKRIFFGELQPLPAEVEERMADYMSPQKLSDDAPVTEYKVLYAVGRLG